MLLELLGRGKPRPVEISQKVRHPEATDLTEGRRERIPSVYAYQNSSLNRLIIIIWKSIKLLRQYR